MTRRPDEVSSIILDVWESSVYLRAQLTLFVPRHLERVSPRDGNYPSLSHAVVKECPLYFEEKFWSCRFAWRQQLPKMEIGSEDVLYMGFS